MTGCLTQVTGCLTAGPPRGSHPVARGRPAWRSPTSPIFLVSCTLVAIVFTYWHPSTGLPSQATPELRVQDRSQQEVATDEDLDPARPHRQRAHGVAGVPARVRVEPRPGTRPDGFALPPTSGGQPARVGDAVRGCTAPRRRPTCSRRRQALAGRAAAHDVGLRDRERRPPEVLRRQRRQLQGPALPPREGGVRILLTREDGRRPSLDRRVEAHAGWELRSRFPGRTPRSTPRACTQGWGLRREAERYPRDPRHRAACRGGHRGGQDHRCRRGHLQPREQRRNQALRR